MWDMDGRRSGERRAYRDRDPPRIRNKSTEDLLKDDSETSKSTPSSPTSFTRAGATLGCFEKCRSDPEFSKIDKTTSSFLNDESETRTIGSRQNAPSAALQQNEEKQGTEEFVKELIAKVPGSSGFKTTKKEVPFNGIITNDRSDCTSCSIRVTNGKDMAPVLGVPPPPPAPHMGPDGLILPRKPNNPYLDSKNHKDLHRELIFNAKVGRNVLNQKSELDRALEKQREAASRKEAERLREESFKDDPRTVLQRAMEQRARHIRLAEQPQNEEPPNPLVTARAKLRTRTDSQ